MYHATLLLGLILVLLIFVQIYLEYKARKNRIASVFKHAAVFIFPEDENGIPQPSYRYPIRSVRYICGRRSKFSPVKTDIVTPSDDMSVSRKSAMFYIKDGSFFIKRLNQQWIWVTDKNNRTIYLLAPEGLDEEKDLRIPNRFCPRGGDNTAYIRLDEDLPLNFGDRLLIGNMLFEFNRTEAHNHV